MGFIADMLQWVLNLLDKYMGQAVNVLTTGPDAFSTPLYNMADAIARGFAAAGTMLVILFFFMNVLSTYSSMTEMKRPEIIFKEMFRLLICNAVVANAFPLMLQITTIGNGLILSGYNAGKNVTGLNGGITFDEALRQKMEDQDFGLLDMSSGLVASFVISLILLIAITGVSIYLLIVCYGRIFKCYMYMAIAPIPLSTFACRNTSEVGKHFLKSYCGVMLQGLILILAVLIFNVFAQTSILDVHENNSMGIMMLEWGAGVLLRLFVLAATIKASDYMVQQMLGL